MRVDISELEGAAVVTAPVHEDERGHFVKIAQGAELAAQTQHQLCSSHNLRAGTLRGLHHQVGPAWETKLVWCVAGAAYDVLVDLRPDCATYGAWAAVELRDPGTAVRVPPGVAHGYQTLADHTVVVYLIDGLHSPDHARTLRWDDPTLDIAWPREVAVISEQDRTAPSWPPAS